MEHRLELEQLTLAEASDLLAGIADRLADAMLVADGTEVRVSGPVDLAVELDASHTSARATITIQCARPNGASRLLQGELARSGG